MAVAVAAAAAAGPVDLDDWDKLRMVWARFKLLSRRADRICCRIEENWSGGREVAMEGLIRARSADLVVSVESCRALAVGRASPSGLASLVYNIGPKTADGAEEREVKRLC